jgi:hypothetical protein
MLRWPSKGSQIVADVTTLLMNFGYREENGNSKNIHDLRIDGVG